MQHDDPVTYLCAVKHAGNAFRTLEPQLEQAIPEGFGMRLTEIRSIHHHPRSKSDVARL